MSEYSVRVSSRVFLDSSLANDTAGEIPLPNCVKTN